MEESILQINNKSYKVLITKEVADFSKSWAKLFSKSIYSRKPYLDLLEKHGPLGYQYYYVLVFEGDQLLSGYYFQRKKLDLFKDFRIHTHKKDFFSKFRVDVLKFLFKFIKHDILIGGNVLLTGEYAHNSCETLDPNLPDHVIKSITKYIAKFEKVKIKTILQKDYYDTPEFSNIKPYGSSFTKLVVQPDMVFKVESSWNDFADYLQAVRSKYRVKFKKVQKKFKDVDFVEMDMALAEKYNDQMYALYKATADRALFSLFTLDPKYFVELKRSLGGDLKLFAVLKEDALLGFFTYVKNGHFADAHFLGYDVSKNQKYQIYFNILLRLVEEAINEKVSYLNLSRTALEIKSSVGALPYGMSLYLKHTNPLLNKLLPFFLSFTVPKNDWQIRSPYPKQGSE